MRRQGLVARIINRSKGLTKQDKTAPKFPDLVRRDFTASRANQKWVGDIERHEALLNRAVVKGHRFRLVAASRKKLRAA